MGVGQSAVSKAKLITKECSTETIKKNLVDRLYKKSLGVSFNHSFSCLSNVASNPSPSDLSKVSNKKAFVDSRDLAKTFDKDHRHVLRDIKNLECSKEFSLSNFGLSDYERQHGYRLIDSATLYQVLEANLLSNRTVKLPKNEYQIRPLLSLPEKSQQVHVWCEVVKSRLLEFQILRTGLVTSSVRCHPTSTNTIIDKVLIINANFVRLTT